MLNTKNEASTFICVCVQGLGTHASDRKIYLSIVVLKMRLVLSKPHSCAMFLRNASISSLLSRWLVYDVLVRSCQFPQPISLCHHSLIYHARRSLISTCQHASMSISYTKRNRIRIRINQCQLLQEEGNANEVLILREFSKLHFRVLFLGHSSAVFLSGL